MADEFIFEGDLSQTSARLQRVIDVIDTDIAYFQQLGDELKVQQLRTARLQLEPQAGAQIGAAGIEKQATAQAKLNAEKQAGAEIDAESLDAINAQTRARAEQLAITERLREAGVGVGITRPVAGWQQWVAGQSAAERMAAAQAYYNDQLAAEAAMRQQSLTLEREQLAADRARLVAQEEQLVTLEAIQGRLAQASTIGYAAGAAGRRTPDAMRDRLYATPAGVPAGAWGNAQREAVRYNLALSEYQGLATRSNLTTEALTANVTQLGLAENRASNALRRHGALTTEYLGALARGETTVREFGYQIGATIGKFAGWTAAAGGTYALLGGIYELGKGAIEGDSAVQRLTRTIHDLNTTDAGQQLRQLSQDVNVPMKEAGNAVFLFSRTFHNLDDAVTVARLALAAYKLDGVEVADSVKAVTAIHQQFGVSAQGMVNVYDQLAEGQQVYNARVTEMIPLLQRSASAVKNAGGDFNDFLQIATIALRTTQLSGPQLGTIFQRAAANFLSPVTTKGQADRAALQQMGINAGPNVGFTDLTNELIRFSAHATGQQRAQIALAFGGPGFGGRVAGIFSPGAAALQGPVRERLGGARGTLTEELQRELATTGARLTSFAHETQRLGFAFADSGIVQVFSRAIVGVVDVMKAARAPMEGFAGLSVPVKDATLTIEALGAALLFMSRTRWGASLAAATRLDRLPFVGPSQAQSARFDLRVGTRSAQQAVAADLERSSQQLVTIGARRLVLAQQATDLDTQAGGALKMDRDQLERGAALKVQIQELEREQLGIEAERNAQLKVQEALVEQQTMLRRSARRGGYTNEEVLALQARGGARPIAGGDPAQLSLFGAATKQEAATVSAMTIAKAKLQVALAAERIAFAEAIDITEVTDAQLIAATSEQTVATAAMSVSATAWGAAGAGARAAGVAARGAATGVIGFVRGIDPLLAGMVLFPIVMGELQKGMDDAKNAAQHAKDALNQPVTSAQSLFDAAKRLQKASADQAKVHTSSGPLGALQDAQVGWGYILGINSWQKVGGDPVGAAKSTGQGMQLHAIGDYYKNAAQLFGMDANDLANTAQGRAELWKVSQQMKGRLQSILANSGLPANEIASIYAAFANTLQKEYSTGLSGAFQHTTGRDQLLSQLAAMSGKQLQDQVSALGAKSDAFGLDPQTMSKAAATYLYLAARYHNSTDKTSLDYIKQAQSAFVTAVDRNVQALVDSAQQATTTGGAIRDLNAAVSDVHTAQRQVESWREYIDKKYRDYPNKVKAMNDAAAQLEDLLGQKLQSVVQQSLQEMESQAQVRASAIQGISPESETARAQSLLASYEQELARARSMGANADQLNRIQNSINTTQQQLAQQHYSDARSQLEAQDNISKARIMGQTPEADIARARADIQRAQDLLNFDRAHGAGAAKVSQDYADLLTAQGQLQDTMRSAAQTMDADARSLIEARGALSEAQTTDPVRQARIELQTAIQALSTIKPQDYKSYAEYQAAIIQQQATIAKDRQNIETQIVDTRMQDLEFQLHTQRITEQQYIAGLQQLLKMHQLAKQQRQQIQTAIFDAMQQGAVSLGTDNIRMPTTYEVKRAIMGAMRRRPEQGRSDAFQQTNVNNTVTLHVTVHRDADLRRFAGVLDDALGGNLPGTAKSMGLV